MTDIVKINKEVQEKAVDERNLRCEPIAEEVIQIIAKANIPARNMADHEEMLKTYSPVQMKIAQLFFDKNLTLGDTNYVWQIVQQILDQAKSLTVNSIQVAFERCEQMLFGVDNMSEVTMKKMDDILLATEQLADASVEASKE